MNVRTLHRELCEDPRQGDGRDGGQGGPHRPLDGEADGPREQGDDREPAPDTQIAGEASRAEAAGRQEGSPLSHFCGAL